MDLISALKNSGNKLLETEAEDLQKWRNLRHTKADLELFLNFNIAEIQYRTVKGVQKNMVCTSNLTLIKLFSLTKLEDKKKIVNEESKGIRTTDLRSVDTWDLIDCKRKSMYINSWQIINFLSITPKNILLLDELIRTLLKY